MQDDDPVVAGDREERKKTASVGPPDAAVPHAFDGVEAQTGMDALAARRAFARLPAKAVQP